MVKRRYRTIQKDLVNNAIAAYYLAIEIHNKPRVPYRYESVCILLCNAWELILKAYVKKYTDKSIFIKDGKTIKMSEALKHTRNHILDNNSKDVFLATAKSIELLESYRNSTVHFYNEKIMEPIVFSLFAKSTIDFTDFVSKYFTQKHFDQEGLHILPIGFKLPFKPEDYLSQGIKDKNLNKEASTFIQNLVDSITDLDDQGIDDSLVVGFQVYMESIKKVSNSDVIAAISSDADNKVKIVKNYSKAQFTNDPTAPNVRLSDDGMLERYPLTYQDVLTYCKDTFMDFKQNNDFYSIINGFKEQPEFAHERRLDPTSKGGLKKTFYSEKVYGELEKHYRRK